MTVKGFDSRARLRRFKIESRGRPAEPIVDLLLGYKQQTKLETHLEPGSWKLVIAFSMAMAVGVNITKAVIFEIFGKPEIVVANPPVETVELDEARHAP